jgi:uncharacterized protein YkwD
MKKLIVILFPFVAFSQINYDRTNLGTIALQQAQNDRRADSIRITRNICTNNKLIDSLNQLIINEINIIRKQHNLPVLQRDKSKDAACRVYAQQMFNDNGIGHYSNHPDAIWEICLSVPQNELAFSNLKNIAKNQVNTWMSSPGHRAVILGKNLDNTQFTSIAIGQYIGILNQTTIIPIISNRTVVRFF